MRQADRKKQKDKIAIALMLCFCVIALTSIFTIKSNLNKIQDSRNQENIGNTAGTSDFVKPVKDESAYVTNEYAMDHLIYSVTLDQYMVHCGVDIEAPADTQVVSMAAGTVTAVYIDDRYGNSVEITQDDGFIAVYSNLSDAGMVEVGDAVSAGQTIGGIGSTGLFESLEPAHLHLELLKDGVYVNPMDYLHL